jgi:hypothetical protein
MPYRTLFLNILVIWRKTLILKFTLLLVGYFSAANLHWLSGLPLSNSHIYSKLKTIQFTPQLVPFGLTQYVPTDSRLDPVSVIPILSAHCLLPLVLSSPIAATAY